MGDGDKKSLAEGGSEKGKIRVIQRKQTPHNPLSPSATPCFEQILRGNTATTQTITTMPITTNCKNRNKNYKTVHRKSRAFPEIYVTHCFAMVFIVAQALRLSLEWRIKRGVKLDMVVNHR